MNERIQKVLTSLRPLGFTDLEAAVYMQLLEGSPVTGYAIAREIGKPVANTYKAIESLAAKGAVIVDEGEHRLCRPVAPGELLKRIEREFASSCAAAEAALASMHSESNDDRVYQLKSREQVVERCLTMIAGAKGSVIVDAFAGPAKWLRDELVNAAARGVKVAALVYAPIEMPGVHLVVARTGTPVDQWYGEGLCVVADGREYLQAILRWDTHEVMQAVWTESGFLSCMQNDDLVCQLFTKAVEREVAEGGTMAAVSAAFESMRPFFTRNTAGYQEAERRARALEVAK